MQQSKATPSTSDFACNLPPLEAISIHLRSAVSGVGAIWAEPRGAVSVDKHSESLASVLQRTSEKKSFAAHMTDLGAILGAGAAIVGAAALIGYSTLGLFDVEAKLSSAVKAGAAARSASTDVPGTSGWPYYIKN